MSQHIYIKKSYLHIFWSDVKQFFSCWHSNQEMMYPTAFFNVSNNISFTLPRTPPKTLPTCPWLSCSHYWRFPRKIRGVPLIILPANLRGSNCQISQFSAAQRCAHLCWSCFCAQLLWTNLSCQLQDKHLQIFPTLFMNAVFYSTGPYIVWQFSYRANCFEKFSARVLPVMCDTERDITPNITQVERASWAESYR